MEVAPFQAKYDLRSIDFTVVVRVRWFVAQPPCKLRLGIQLMSVGNRSLDRLIIVRCLGSAHGLVRDRDVPTLSDLDCVLFERSIGLLTMRFTSSMAWLS